MSAIRTRPAASRQVQLGRRRPGRLRSTAEPARPPRCASHGRVDAGPRSPPPAGPLPPALRTRQTWAAVSEQLDSGAEVRFPEPLYLASPDTILSLIRDLATDVGTALVIGHNPGLGEAMNRLAPGGQSAARRRMAHKVPTAALAVLRWEGGWDEAGNRGREIRALDPGPAISDASDPTRSRTRIAGSKRFQHYIYNTVKSPRLTAVAPAGRALHGMLSRTSEQGIMMKAIYSLALLALFAAAPLAAQTEVTYDGGDGPRAVLANKVVVGNTSGTCRARWAPTAVTPSRARRAPRWSRSRRASQRSEGPWTMWSSAWSSWRTSPSARS